jgi:hypothetical protein
VIIQILCKDFLADNQSVVLFPDLCHKKEAARLRQPLLIVLFIVDF